MDKLEWDLEILLNGKTVQEKIEEHLSLVKEEIKLKNSFFDSKENFAKWDQLSEKSMIASHRLGAYISYNLSTNLKSKKFNDLMQEYSFKMQELSSQLSDISNIIIDNEEKIRELLKDDQFKHLRRDYQLLFDSKKHILSPKEEALMSKIGPTSGGYGDVFSILTNIEMGFESVKDSSGEKHPITISNISMLLKSKDRVLREKAYTEYYSKFLSKKKTLSTLLFQNYFKLNEFAKVRNYDSYIHRALDADELENEKVLQAFYSVCAEEESREIVKKYKRIKKAILKKKYNLDKVEPWDMSLDISSNETRYTPEQAQKIAINATKVMGREWTSVIKKAFNENWISWMPTEGKRSGAYSGGRYGMEKKYIFLNWFGLPSDLSTLLHELGHAIHTYYSDKEQTYNNASYTIFNAEVASTTAELLLHDYQKKNFTGEDKVELLDDWCSAFLGTIIRQIQFSKFEYEIVNKINKGIPVNEDSMMEEYGKIQDSIYGKSEELTEIQKQYSKVTGLRIPHFYVGNFYVYKYAVGLVTALTIANRIKTDPKSGVKNFLDYLKAGSSKPPLDIIKMADVDLEDPQTIRNAYKLLDKVIDELEQAAKENNMI